MSGENLDVDAEARTGAVIERNDRVIRDIVRRQGRPYEEIRAEVRRGAMTEAAERILANLSAVDCPLGDR